MNYPEFIKLLDLRLNSYFQLQQPYIKCHKGCSLCCQKGDYPLSATELQYLMQGYIKLDDASKNKVQANVKNMQRGEICPFLIDNICSVYAYRPIVCRVHGLAYLFDGQKVKLPYCVNFGKNFSEVYKDGVFCAEPIKTSLDTLDILENTNFGEIRNLYDWIKSDLA